MTDHDLKKALQGDKYWQGHLKGEYRRKIQAITKKQGRNDQPQRVRRKNWQSESGAEDGDELDYANDERIMPRTERERRRSVAQKAFVPADEAEADETPMAGPNTHQGQVIEISSSLYQVDLAGRVLACRASSRLKAQERVYTNVVAVGDEVLVSENGADSGMIETVLPRRSVLARPDVFYSHLRQIIVANADQLLIVSSWRDPALWPELIDRYLIAAERSQLPAVICVNKTDLAGDETECQVALQPYTNLGYRVILTSALTGRGLADLRAALQHKTTVLAGLSGVGKSSLLTAVQPGLELRVGEVSQRRHEGKHTTTQATLLRLEVGTVIDTPGIREFGLAGLRRAELVEFFPEMVALAPNCRFNNCTHLSEPDCAVRAGLTAGKVAESRYHSYRQILEELSN